MRRAGACALLLCLATTFLPFAECTKLRSKVVDKRSGSKSRVNVGAMTMTLTHHVKLDVGLKTFQESVNEMILNGPMNNANLSTLKGFDDATKKKFKEDVISKVNQSFAVSMAPLKKAIGKTWMTMPEDGKDEFVKELKGSFDSVFERMGTSFPRNGAIMMSALKEYPPKSLTLAHAEDALFKSFNKTVYRIENSLAGYVDMDSKSIQFSLGPKAMALLEVV